MADGWVGRFLVDLFCLGDPDAIGDVRPIGRNDCAGLQLHHCEAGDEPDRRGLQQLRLRLEHRYVELPVLDLFGHCYPDANCHLHAHERRHRRRRHELHYGKALDEPDGRQLQRLRLLVADRLVERIFVHLLGHRDTDPERHMHPFRWNDGCRRQLHDREAGHKPDGRRL